MTGPSLTGPSLTGPSLTGPSGWVLDADLGQHIDLDGRRLELTRAWPRAEGVVHLDYRDAQGSVLAGQWCADPARLARVARATGRPGRLLGDRGILLHVDGADRRLTALPSLVAGPGHRLVGHRPERRAVLIRGDGCYLKVLRPGRTRAVVEASARVGARAGADLAVPDLLEHREDDGVLVWSGLAGPTLHDLAVDPARDPAGWRAAWRRAGLAVAALHGAPEYGPPHAGDMRLPRHGVEDECRAALSWLEPAVGHGLLPAPGSDALTEALAPLRHGAPGPEGLLHRDLHDKQLIVSPGDGPIGLIDADTAAVGERAVDVANLLVHVELRVRQGLLARDAATDAIVSFLDGLGPAAATLTRVGSFARVTRLRLAGVYAFRPRWAAVARDLLGDALRADAPQQRDRLAVIR